MTLGIGLLTLWLLRSGHRIRDLLPQAILGLTGRLRTRPDPWLEGTLRAAFAEFDRELALILRDRTYPLPARADSIEHVRGRPRGEGIGC